MHLNGDRTGSSPARRCVLALIGLEVKNAAGSLIPCSDPPALPLLLDRGEGRGEESSVCVARKTWGRSHPSPQPSPR